MSFFDQHSTAVYAQPGFDKTRYQMFHTAGGPGNTDLLWLDESGHGNHWVGDAEAGDNFIRTTDAQGRKVYRGSEETGALFRFAAGFGPSDFTIYTRVRKANELTTFFLDAFQHSLLLGMNNTDAGVIYWPGSALGLGLGPVAGQLTLMAWRLNSVLGTVRVYINDPATPVLTGAYPVKRAMTGPVTLGHDYSSYYAPFYGDIHEWVLRTDNDTDAEFQQTWEHLSGLS